MFVLQRVNSTFQATIARNKLIQQRMFLAPLLADTKGTHAYSRIEWFGENVRVADQYCGLHLTYSEKNKYLSERHRKARCVCQLPRDAQGIDGGPEASWREMQLHCIEKGEPLRLSFKSSGPSILLAVFLYEDDMTMGQLHDGLLRLMEDLREYAEEWAEYNDIYWGLDDDIDGIGDVSLGRIEKMCARGDLWK